MTRRLLEWPYWLPTLRGARSWLTAGANVFGIYRRNPQPSRWR